MLESEYDCHEKTIVGPLDMQSFRQYERSHSADYPHMIYDQVYSSYVQKNHGGVPKRQWFKTEKGSVRQLGRFVNYGGPYNEPFQDNWEIPGPVDMRESWNINTLETIGNIADGCGAFLVPFGLLCKGERTPDEIGTTYIDLLCFDYSNEQLNTPEVVVWNNSDACREYYASREAGLNSWTEMRHERFTERVAISFRWFMLSLFESKAHLQ